MENKVKELEEKLLRKEQECEGLKADLKSLEYTLVLQSNRDIDNATDLFAKRIVKIENENSILKAENKKLKQTLADIKEIAEKQCVCGVDCMDMKQILQTISECEVENES